MKWICTLLVVSAFGAENQTSPAVSAPLPTISAVVNAASGASAAVSPGELISLFAPASGANPIGPATAVALDATTCPSPCTSVPKNMGGVTVTFLPSGLTAPLLYVSATQINAIVPYGVGAGGLSVEVKYADQSSNIYPLSFAATAPGLFATNGGTGLAASYQLDTQANFSYNTTATPAKAGWTIVLYMTGEGAVTPAAATGGVTVAKNTTPPVPVPASAPTVLIGNQPATVSFYGEAPGLVSGVLQLNVVVPAGAGTGQQPISISLGNASTQAGVTVALQ